MMGKPPLSELILNNVYFDTCVYHQPGINTDITAAEKEMIFSGNAKKVFSRLNLPV